MYQRRTTSSFSFYSPVGYKGGFGEVLKPHNLLYHPLSFQPSVSSSQSYFEDIDLQFQLSIGNTVIPEMPTLGVQDNYKHLQETRNNHVSIKPHMYRTNSFLAGFNLKKLNSANYTGLNLKNNSNMVVRIKPLYGTTPIHSKQRNGHGTDARQDVHRHRTRMHPRNQSTVGYLLRLNLIKNISIVIIYRQWRIYYNINRSLETYELRLIDPDDGQLKSIFDISSIGGGDVDLSNYYIKK